MVAFKILAGGYDVFVATYIFNSTSSSLSLASKSPTGPSPSWISLHPTNKSILYAVNEVTSGALQSFVISPEGTLTPPNDTVSSGGDSPAFATALSTGAVAVFNYNSGNGRIVPTTSSNPTDFDNSAPVISFPQPPPPNVSHPHMALEYGKEVLVPDLGGDTIWRLARSSTSANYQIQGSIPQPKGSGPRHIAIANNRLFTLHELASTLSVQTLPAAPNGTSTLIATASIIPPNPPAGAAFAAAEILIPPTTKAFPTQYIYVSNRNTGVQDPRGDAIAIFQHVNVGTSSEGLKLIKHVYTGIDQPRGMAFGPADGRGGEAFLVVAGVAGSAGTKIFKRVDGGRDLQLVATNLDIPTRTTFVWL
ncbi:putative lactonase, 7-bladed beta-propeller [Lyophyllum shimeji]|uniref:Lactonase, 7-bladed beta-propeller n=1 Tax=Lyophyllum shimeji TaxID=47721 RepID=A0A9P3PS06_LYOSH|nr:putative lactonase, 7-bladed beta-propeller [Lyophyllum shimeji]